MARSSECTGLLRSKVLDDAGIVRDACLRQLTLTSGFPVICPRSVKASADGILHTDFIAISESNAVATQGSARQGLERELVDLVGAPFLCV